MRVSLALFMSGIAVAQSVTPSNATLPTSESTKESVLMLSGTAVFTSANYLLAPLTTGTGIDQPSVQVWLTCDQTHSFVEGNLLTAITLGDQHPRES